MALVQALLAQRQQSHQSRLIEHIVPSDVGYQQTLSAVTHFFQAQGANATDAAAQAFAYIAQTLQTQVNLLAYIDVFWALTLMGAIMAPLALTLRSIDMNAPARH